MSAALEAGETPPISLPEDLRQVERSLAYERAEELMRRCFLIHEDYEHNLWFVIAPPESLENEAGDVLRYLTARGLLEASRHNRYMVRLRDESEATL